MAMDKYNNKENFSSGSHGVPQPQPLDEQVVRAQALMAAAAITAGVGQGYARRDGADPKHLSADLGDVMREMFKKSLFLLLFEGQEDKGL